MSGFPKLLVSERTQLPEAPGVYLFFNAQGVLMYVGKATSLRSRAGSYFRAPSKNGPTRAIEEVVSEIAHLEYKETPTVLEALFLEAELIRKYKPPYNVLLKDDKSFLWICFTADEYPRVVLVRGKDLEMAGADKKYPKRWGPFMNAKTVRRALDLLRHIFPWSDCVPDQKRPCFNAQIGRCPGVCTRAISPTEYKKILARMALFLNGKRVSVEKKLQADMTRAAAAHDFEIATTIRNQLFALQHIQDVALIGQTDDDAPVSNLVANPFKRVEGYDISHLSGTGMVASMVVFNGGEADKKEYRKFEIKGFTKSNDVGALKEVLTRRLAHTDWPLPEIFFIDGGEGQVNAVMKVLKEHKVVRPVVGIAKGVGRKNIRYVFDRRNVALDRAIRLCSHIFVKVRNESHRFAITYQRKKRQMRDFGV
ncbi:MAG: GIY-YIG nuclease family protein [Candidatus Magasanikbacteria bacterium]|nr:GIY-YIG nuclease family protein [Candidatus Magasanikbacteria bacterium]